MDNGSKYSSKTLIGNWNEEVALKRAEQDIFKKKSIDGSGSWKQMQFKKDTCNSISPISALQDNCLRFGDKIMFQHVSTGLTLSNDPFDEVMLGDEMYRVSVGNNESGMPRARFVFTVTRPPPSLQSFGEDSEDDLVLVGQPFQLCCSENLLVSQNPDVQPSILYLCSTKKNDRMSTKSTNRQLVYMKPSDYGNDPNSIWTIDVPSCGRKNGIERFLKKGSPVSVEDMDNFYLLVHRQTNMYLTCDPKVNFVTEMGVEVEVFADRTSGFGKLGLMVSEAEGRSTCNTLTKPDANTFVWSVVGATNY